MKKLLKIIVLLLVFLAGFQAYTYVSSIVKDPTIYWDRQPVEEMTDTGGPVKFYYSLLTPTEQQAYNAILSEIYTFPESIVIPNLKGDSLHNVFSALVCDNPDLYFLDRTCSIEEFTFLKDRFIPDYSINSGIYNARNDDLVKKTKEIVKELNFGDDDWENEKKIHDYIVNHVDYKYNSVSGIDDWVGSAYGALVKGKASCEGYARAAQYLMNIAGIKSVIVTGDARNSKGEVSKHMWNAVELGGNWYYLDCTWDDPVGKNGMNYTYFNVTTETISQTHSDFSYDFPCNSTEMNYHYRKGTYFTTYSSETPDKIKDIVVESLKDGSGKVELRFTTKEAFEKAKLELLESKNRKIDSILRNAVKESGIKVGNSFSYVEDSDALVLIFTLEIKSK